MGDPHEKAWDVAIVGAGMGGSALAYSLALSGRRVLIIERGAAAMDRGAGGVDMAEGEELIRLGQWPDRIKGTVDGVTSAFLPSLGCGLGGSTLLYAAALERFQRDDFQTPADGEGRAPAWPVPYDDMAPFTARRRSVSGCAAGSIPCRGLAINSGILILSTHAIVTSFSRCATTACIPIGCMSPIPSIRTGAG